MSPLRSSVCLEALRFSFGLSLGLACVGASAQITVVGEGRAAAAPDAAVVIATVSGQAERADDAVVRYADVRRQLDAGLADEAGDWATLDVRPMGVSVAYVVDPRQAMMFDGDPEGIQSDVRASEDLALVWALPVEVGEAGVLDGLMQLAADIEGFGGSLMPAPTANPYTYQGGDGLPMFAFLLRDGSGLRARARAAAVADARRQAEELAALAGLRVTGVESIRTPESGAESTASYSWVQRNDPASRYRNALGPEAVLAQSMTRAELVVRLNVTFAVAPVASEASAQASDP